MSRALSLVLVLAGLPPALMACKNGDVKAPPPASMPAPASPSSPPQVAASPSVVLRPPGREVVFKVELAGTEAERQRGLMYRERLDPDAGMLFIFETPGPLSFWMKNTLIPLDMIFIGADRAIVGIVENAEPHTTTGRSVPGDSQFVLEINGGLSSRLGIAAGQPVELRNLP